MGKVLNIYGIEVDNTTFEGPRIKKWRSSKPIFWHSEYLEKWLRQQITNNKEPFFIYCHKTKEYNVNSIIYQGLNIYEKNGGIHSAMSRIFDSESIDIEGDINYFLNAVITSNQYGYFTILALIPKYMNIMQDIKTKSIVPMDYLAFGVDKIGKVIAYGPQSDVPNRKKCR